MSYRPPHYSAATASTSKWASSNRSGNGGGGSEISATGFKPFTKNKTIDPILLLTSPSRGIGHGTAVEDSLQNHQVQETFRLHIAVKLERLLPILEGAQTEEQKKKRQEDLSIILLDFRKLREGIRSVSRVDDFAVEVYEASARYAIAACNYQQLGSCLPHLVLEIYPVVSCSYSSLSLSSLSLDSTIQPTSTSTKASLEATKSFEQRRSYFTHLYLLYLLCYLNELTSFHATLHSLTSSLPSVSSEFEYARSLYASLLTRNYVRYRRQLDSQSDPEMLQLSRLPLVAMRETTFAVLAKAYTTFSDLTWLSRTLCFPEEEEERAREYLKVRGKIL